MYGVWGFENMTYTFIVIIPYLAYNIITNIIFNGSTLGQKICGVNCIQNDDENINLSKIIILQVIRILYVTPYIFIPMILQGFIGLFIRESKTLEQHITKTKYVVKMYFKKEREHK